MHEAAGSPLTAWESFYVIVGTSAAALTGLQFVVIALITEAGARRSDRQIAAFGTPTVVHFCAALLLSALLSAPFARLSSLALALGVAGVVGVAYTAIVTRRARSQTGYKPVLEDWIWHAILPFSAYAAVLGAAVALRPRPAPALFAVGAASVLLLFIGIHNAWDTVTYISLEGWKLKDERGGGPREGGEGGEGGQDDA